MGMVGRGVEVGESGEGLEPRSVGVPELRVQESSDHSLIT